MFQFKRALREQVGLLVGLAGASGSGKTMSALRLAKGIAGDKPFALIDSEAGRSKMYADSFTFDHGDLKPPFRPQTFTDAIMAADAEHYPVIVVDSMSLVWSGDGGVLDWHEEELERMAGDDYGKRERVKMAAWIRPKTAHKAMMQKLLQVRAHLILCFRAEEKIEMVKQDGKLVIVPKKSSTSLDGWIPVCDKSMPYELTCSFLLTADRPGFPKPIKLPDMLKPMFPLDKPIDEESGKRVAVWAAGGTATSRASSTAQAVAPLNVEELIDAIIDAPDMDALQKAFDAAKSATRPLKDNALLQRITATKDERKAKLAEAEAL